MALPSSLCSNVLRGW
ncbi:hypothetical protein M3J09_003447 [Ascochyta lentis]